MTQIKRRKMNYQKYWLAFFITVFVFVIGIYVGSSLDDSKLTEISRLNDDIRTTTLAVQTQFDLINENPCEFIDDTFLFEELLEVSSKVEYLENQLGQQNSEVRRLKEYYSTLLIKYWLFVNKIKEECPFCDSQGHILSNIRKDYSNIRVFSFDYTLDNAALRTLKKMFIDEVERFPILIINGGETHQGFMSRVSIERELGL